MNIKSAEEFFHETKKAFQYLERDLNYRLISSEIENTEHYPDSFAFVRYLGERIGIEVYWFFAAAAIDIALVEITKIGEFPQKKRFWGESRGEARAISLHTLMDMLGKGDLYMIRKLRATKLSDVKKREKVICEKLRDVMENLAQILREQATDTLLGDTTIFSDVQKHEEKLLRKEYPAQFE